MKNNYIADFKNQSQKQRQIFENWSIKLNMELLVVIINIFKMILDKRTLLPLTKFEVLDRPRFATSLSQQLISKNFDLF